MFGKASLALAGGPAHLVIGGRRQLNYAGLLSLSPLAYGPICHLRFKTHTIVWLQVSVSQAVTFL